MVQQLRNTISLLKLIGLMLLIFMLIRVVFYAYNYSFFGSLNAREVWNILVCGIRMDLSAIAYANVFFIIFYLIPFPFRRHLWYRIFLTILFALSNFTAIVINTGDIIYYSFNSKRLTYEVVAQWSDFMSMLPEYLLDYWYAVILLLAELTALVYLYIWIDKRNEKPSKFNYIIQALLFVITFGLAFLAGRGSLGRKPMTPITASGYVEIRKAPIATNSVFTLIHSYQKTSLHELHYFSDQELPAYFSIKRQYHGKPKKLNVVIIILESFSREFVGYLNHDTGYTPFLDSLMRHSLVCTQAYSDAERSIKGVASVLSGLPNMMEEDLQSSTYQTNCIPSIASFLKSKGYNTSFFHGGVNGTMNFDAYTKAVGFDNYYGRNEFANDQFFDGSWGIWDEEFFQFYAGKLKSFKEPFCSAIFSLSSHHPYKIPERYKNRFPKGKEQIHETIGYTDYALRKFFEAAQKQHWFKRTLFFITADHSIPTRHPVDTTYMSPVGAYSIPVCFFLNGKLKGTIPD